jgi:uncharacterized membrane protein YgcG
MAADSIALLFKMKQEGAKGVADDVGKMRASVVGDVKDIQSIGSAAFNSFGKSIGLSTGQVASFRSSLPAVATGIAAVGGAVIGAGAALFSFAKNASDAGSEIFDLKSKTGLGAESLSAIKFAAEQSGSSIQDAAQAFVVYEKNLTKAAQKGETLFGIDAQRAVNDSEFALRALTEVLNGPMPAGYNKTTLAAELMGRSGANLVATFDTMGRSFDEFLAQARKMGVVLSEEDVRAADEFGDSLSVLGAQASAVGNKFALEFAPDITKAMKDVSTLITENKGIIQGFGTAVSIAIGAVTSKFQEWRFELALIKGLWAGMPVGNALTVAGGVTLPSGGSASPTTTSGQGTGEGVNSAVMDAEMKRLEKQAEDAEKLAAKVREEVKRIAEQARAASRQAAQTEAETAYQAALDLAERNFQATADHIAYIKALQEAERVRWNAAIDNYNAEHAEIIKTVEGEELRAAKIRALNADVLKEKAEHEKRKAELTELGKRKTLAALQEEHKKEIEWLEIRNRELDARSRASAQAGVISYKQAAALIKDNALDVFTARMKHLEDELKAAQGNAEEEKRIRNEITALQRESLTLEREYSAMATDAKIADLKKYEAELAASNERIKASSGGMFDAPGGLIGGGGSPSTAVGPIVTEAMEAELGKIPVPDFSGWEAAIKQIKGMALDSFKAMAQGFGAMVNTWVMTGKLGEGGVRKLVASVLGSFAMMAATQALMELAYGFAALTPWGAAIYGPAPFHFKAAALLGAAAATSALLGRAVAGNSFSEGGGGSSSGGGASQPDVRESKRLEYEREQAEKNKYTRSEERRGSYTDVPIVLELDGSQLGKAIARIWSGGGDLRETVRRDFKLA